MPMVDLTFFAWLLVGAAVVQLLVAYCYCQYFKQLNVTRMPEAQQSGVSVIMCIRGCDPTLRKSLINILDQDFRDYLVHVMVDHREDIAWRIVHEIKQEFDVDDRLQIHEMTTPFETCGLKCSALVQGLGELAPDTRYVALLDADVATHGGWLSELIGPLENDRTIGAVMGSQWFEPPVDANWGAFVRSSWNAGALVPTVLFRNPWAGSLAMRLEDIHRAELAKVWRFSMIDDGPVRNALEEIGLRMHFAPSLIMINREDCTFDYAWRWVARMLTWSRLYETTFFLPIMHALFSNTVMLINFGLLGWGLVVADFGLVTAMGLGLISSGLLSVSAYAIVRGTAARSCRLRGESLAPVAARQVGQMLLTVPLTQLVYGWGVCRALVAKQITWRKITYQIHGKQRIQMLGYRPFQDSSSNKDSHVSI